MAKFVLTAQLRLQAPRNVAQVVQQIQQQLSSSVNIPVNVQNAPAAARQIQQITAATNQATTAANQMGKAFGVSLKRFTTFSIASRAVGLFSNRLSAAIQEAIDFQQEMVRLSQVTDESLTSLRGVEEQITRLATTFGVSSKSLQSVTTVLAQAGLKARDLEVALDALAKTALAPTFGDIKDTAEGAIAILAQFEEGTGALERQLGAINEVSAKFAVESEDLISVIRRTGGVFKASGGSLEELLALFTSIRATTREGAESIATGLRTILTRIQRPKTIQYLRQFGVELEDLNGKFVGPYEATRQLSEALSGLEQGDITFIRIAEELGGFRQIGKVIPLLQQFRLAEEARQAAIAGGSSLTQDQIDSQQALAIQINKVREDFLALVRGIADTSTFKVLLTTTLNIASAFIKIADTIKPLLPLIAAFAAFKFARGIGGFLGGVGAGLRTRGYNQGGLVPGVGNTDTVPAMLTPGEFVVKKQSVKKLGANNLAKMNKGGVVQRNLGYIDSDVLADPSNATVVRREMEKLGITNIPDYKMYLSGLAANARKKGDISKYKAIAAMAGAGKSYLMLGGKNAAQKDNAQLRKTNRFPILTPDDVARSNEIVDTTATVTKEKLENWLKAADRVYTLSTSTKEEQDEIKRRRGIRDETGVNLFGRNAGTTKTAPIDSGEMEALLGSEIEPGKLTVLGIRKDKPLRRKGADERVGVVKKKIGLFYGSFSPTTVGHESMMDAAMASGVSPQDFLVLVGSNEALKTKDPHSFRTAVFDQDFRAILAAAGFGARGAMISKKATRDFGIPKAMEVSPTARGQRRFIVPEGGSLAMVAAKDEKASKKYTDAGYKVTDVPRDEGNISGTLAREAILSGNINEMKRLLSPEVFEVVQKNLKQLRNRAEILPRIIESVRRKEVASLSEIEAMLAKLPARIDKKKVAADPDYARQAEEVLALRKRRDKIKSAASWKPFDLIAKLSKRYPEKYGLGTLQYFNSGGLVPGTGNRDTVPAMLTPGEFVIRKSSVESIGAQNLAMMNAGGPVETIEMKNTSKKSAPVGQIAISASPSETTGPQGANANTTVTLSNRQLELLLRKPGDSGIDLNKTYLGEQDISQKNRYLINGNIHRAAPDFKDSSKAFSKDFVKQKLKPVDDQIKKLIKEVTSSSFEPRPIAQDTAAISTISGYAFESFLSGLIGASPKGGQESFDFVLNNKQRQELQKYTEKDPLPNIIDAKASFKSPSKILKKAINFKLKDFKTNRVRFEPASEKLKKAIKTAGGSRSYSAKTNRNRLTAEQKEFIKARSSIVRNIKSTKDLEAVSGVLKGRFLGGVIQKFNKGAKVELEPSTDTDFTHLDSLDIKQLSKQLKVPSTKNSQEEAFILRRLYSKVGVDLPSNWNQDWGSSAGRNDVGIYAKSLKDYVESARGNIFNTLINAGKYGLRKRGSENVGATILSENKDKIAANFASRLSSSKSLFYDVDDDVISSNVAESLFAAINNSQVVSELRTFGAAKRVGSKFRFSLNKDQQASVNQQVAYTDTGLQAKFFGGILRRYAEGSPGGVQPLSPEELAEYRKNLGATKAAKLLGISLDSKSKRRVNPTSAEFDPSLARRALNMSRSQSAQEQQVISALPIYGAAFLKRDTTPPETPRTTKLASGKEFEYVLKSAFIDQGDATRIENDIVSPKVIGIINSVAGVLSKSVGGDAPTDVNIPNKTAILGSIFESALSKAVKQNITETADDQRTFDFPAGLGSLGTRIFGAEAAALAGVPTDAKATSSSSAIDSIRSKVKKDATLKGFNTGGDVGTDTVPALLTPGEFVVNKKAAQRIGYGNLDRMNKFGVSRFAQGGSVGVQRFANGTGPTGARGGGTNTDLFVKFSLMSGAINGVLGTLGQLTKNADGTSTAISRLTDSALSMINTVTTLIFALQAFGVSLSVQQFKDLFKTAKGGLGDLLGGFTKREGSLRADRRVGERFSGGRQRVESRKTEIKTATKERINARKEQKAFNRRERPVDDFEAAEYDFEKKRIQDRVTEANKRSDTLKKQIRRERPSSLTGRLGDRLAILGKKSGFKGGAARLATSAITRGGALLGGGALGGVAASIAAFSGPLLGAGLAVKALSALFTAAIDAQGQYNTAIKEGNVAKAEEMAVLKEVPGIVQYFGAEVAGAYRSLGAFIGFAESNDTLKQRAKVEALSNKFELDKIERTKAAEQALEDFKNGLIGATEAAVKNAQTFIETSTLREEREKQVANLEAEKSGGLGGFFRNVFTVGGLFGETKGQKNRRIDEEIKQTQKEGKNLQSAEFENFRKTLTPLSKQSIIAGQSFEQFINSLEKQSIEETGKSLVSDIQQVDKGLETLRKDFANQQKAIQQNIKYVQSLNFGLIQINGAAKQTTASLERLVGSFDSGYNSFENALSVLEMSTSSAASSLSEADFNKAFGKLSESLVSSGANPADIKKAEDSVRGLYIAQQEASSALEKTKQFLISSGEPPSGDKLREVFTKELENNLKLQGVDDATRQRIVDSLSGLKLDDQEIQQQLAAGDFGGLVEKALGPIGEAVNKEVLGPIQERAKQENILINLTKQRIDIERAALDAAKQAIDTQIEARKVIEEFGGPALTSADKLQALNDQLNIDLRAAGVSSLGSGGSAQLSAIQSELSRSFGALQDRQNISVMTSGTGAFSGAAGIAEDRRPQIEQAQQAVLDYSRKRIDLIREEITLAEKKNQLEKDAIDKLLGGDIEGFIQSQSASAASSALRSGDTQIARLFGPAALGEAVKSLQDQLGPGEKLQAAVGTALSSIGIQDPRMAQIYSGTTPEVQSLKEEGKAIANNLAQAGLDLASVKQMQVTTQEVLINSANVKFSEASQRAASATTQTSQGISVIQAQAYEGIVPQQNFANGGFVKPIYASTGRSRVKRGTFTGLGETKLVEYKPQGKDTQPAMVEAGEAITRKAAVDKYGPEFFEDVNNLTYDPTWYGFFSRRYNEASGLASDARDDLYKAGRGIKKNFEPVTNSISTFGGRINSLRDSYSPYINPISDGISSFAGGIGDAARTATGPLASLFGAFGTSDIVGAATTAAGPLASLFGGFGASDIIDAARTAAGPLAGPSYATTSVTAGQPQPTQPQQDSKKAAPGFLQEGSTSRMIADFIPFLGSALDLGSGISDLAQGNILSGLGKTALGVGGLALDFFTLGGGSLIKGGLKAGAKALLKGGAKFGLGAAKSLKGFKKSGGVKGAFDGAKRLLGTTKDNFKMGRLFPKLSKQPSNAMETFLKKNRPDLDQGSYAYKLGSKIAASPRLTKAADYIGGGLGYAGRGVKGGLNFGRQASGRAGNFARRIRDEVTPNLTKQNVSQLFARQSSANPGLLGRTASSLGGYAERGLFGANRLSNRIDGAADFARFGSQFRRPGGRNGIFDLSGRGLVRGFGRGFTNPGDLATGYLANQSLRYAFGGGGDQNINTGPEQANYLPVPGLGATPQQDLYMPTQQPYVAPQMQTPQPVPLPPQPAPMSTAPIFNSAAVRSASSGGIQSGVGGNIGGGIPMPGISISPEIVKNLSDAFNRFSDSVKELKDIKLSVKLDTTNVNVNFNGAGFLENLTQDVRNGVLKTVKEEITNKLEIGNDGKARFNEGR